MTQLQPLSYTIIKLPENAQIILKDSDCQVMSNYKSRGVDAQMANTLYSNKEDVRIYLFLYIWFNTRNVQFGLSWLKEH